jgi:hypothetical protein
MSSSIRNNLIDGALFIACMVIAGVLTLAIALAAGYIAAFVFGSA